MVKIIRVLIFSFPSKSMVKESMKNLSYNEGNIIELSYNTLKKTTIERIKGIHEKNEKKENVLKRYRVNVDL